MKCELCCDNNCLDLPSLTEIKGHRYIHYCMGYVILESMIWFDLIWFDLTRHSKSHWKQHSLWRRIIWIHCWFTSNKYFSISFPFSRFRCLCSRKSHSRNVEIFEKLEKPTFLSLAENNNNKKIEFCRCRNRCLFDCIQFQPFSQSNCEGVSSSLTNAKNHTFHSFIHFFLEFHQLLRTSRFQTSFHISRFQQSSNQKEEERKCENVNCLCSSKY